LLGIVDRGASLVERDNLSEMGWRFGLMSKQVVNKG
jgi:hypothetical protein